MSSEMCVCLCMVDPDSIEVHRYIVGFSLPDTWILPYRVPYLLTSVFFGCEVSGSLNLLWFWGKRSKVANGNFPEWRRQKKEYETWFASTIRIHFISTQKKCPEIFGFHAKYNILFRGIRFVFLYSSYFLGGKGTNCFGYKVRVGFFYVEYLDFSFWETL